MTLPEATDDFLELVRAACRGARSKWKAGYRYSKAGVVTVDLVSPGKLQRALIGGFNRERSDALMAAMDAVNARCGRGTCRPAAAGFEHHRKGWAIKFEMRSPRYTTRIDEVPRVSAR